MAAVSAAHTPMVSRLPALLGKALVRRVARGAGVVRCIHIAAMRSRRHAAKRLTFFGMICCWYAQRPQRVA